MPTVKGTIDSVSMLHLCRAPAPRVKIRKRTPPELGLQVIANAMIARELKLFIDQARGLSDEWVKTCSHEIIMPLMTKWIEVGGIGFCNAAGVKVPTKLTRKLRQANFVDAGDKLVVRIGLAVVSEHGANPFFIATNDGDFWDPRDGSMIGKAAAEVSQALAEHNVASTTLKQFFGLIS